LRTLILGRSLAQTPIDVLPSEMPYIVSVQVQASDFGYHENAATGIILDETHVLTVTPFWPIEKQSIVSGITNLLSIYIGLGKRHTIKNVKLYIGYEMN